MNEIRVKGRTCGVNDAAKPAQPRTYGPGEGTGAPSAGPARRATGFTIRPMCAAHRRSLDLALQMGHCAPAVMAALVADGDPGRDSAVLLASAMAGGIGNSGRECGALTSSILHLGERHGRPVGPEGVALSITLSQRLIERFRETHGGTRCDEIRKGGKNPLPCMKAMVSAPALVEEVIGQSPPRPDDTGPDCHASGLLSACRARHFHCVHSVFAGLSGIVPECERLGDMTYPLVGGCALTGGTCAAASAGVLAIGLTTGKIETSYARVMAMMARMFLGGDAMMMPDHVNDFNPAINRGKMLVEWFEHTYGTTSCAELTGLTVRESEKAGRYFAEGGIERCEAMAAAVAVKAREIIEGTKQK